MEKISSDSHNYGNDSLQLFLHGPTLIDIKPIKQAHNAMRANQYFRDVIPTFLMAHPTIPVI